ncbi:hypothetical protein D9613_007582 [Agrocybe pediades]|uniref:F-box domain-containing protein n=1 Tax=Agrocybe pediades TaxID=84607 RepID=A0A8H4VN51_9AGAR|nr:hypothetical protein D9613_007582 [Agrocybe pediades]
MPESTVPLLGDEELTEWVRGAGPPNEHERARIHQTIDFHQSRLQHISCQLDGTLNPMAKSIEDSNRVDSDGIHMPIHTSSPKRAGVPLSLTKIQELTEMREQSQSSLKKLESLLAPIRRIPLELLDNIFIHCLPRERFMKPDITEAPISIMGVCRVWRDISINVPELWTSLDLTEKERNLPRRTDPNQCNRTALLDLYFKRAGSRLPLSLCIDDGPDTVPFNITTTYRKLSHRWQHLKVYQPKCDYFSFPPGDYSNLETFELVTPTGMHHTSTTDMAKALCLAPRLQQFIWTNQVLHPLHCKLDLKWGRLTRISLNTSINVDQCLTIMSQAKRVTHLAFKHISISSATLSNLNIVLPRLKSFVLHTEYNAAFILNEITAPKLQELVLNLRTWPHDAVKAMLLRSRCPIESLNLYFPPVSEPELIETLELVQGTLKELTVQNDAGVPSISETILARMTDTGVEPVLCPKVAVIALYGCLKCSPGSFHDMVLSRINPPSRTLSSEDAEDTDAVDLIPTAPLRVLEMYADEAEQLRVAELRNNGLVLKVYTREGKSVEMDEEEAARLRALRENGLVIRAYSPTTGHFGELDD